MIWDRKQGMNRIRKYLTVNSYSGVVVIVRVGGKV